jgi:hypothetical protein
MRQRLDDWRGSHKRGAAFAPKLWSAVGRVARRHGAYVTARALGLDYNKVRAVSGGVIDAVSGKVKATQKPDPMKFIELTDVLPVSSSGCRLSLQNANGQRLQLEMAPSAATELVLQLCRSGWSASP